MTLTGRRILKTGVAPTGFPWTGAVLKGGVRRHNACQRKKECSFRNKEADEQHNGSRVRAPDHDQQTICQQAEDPIQQLIGTKKRTQKPPQRPEKHFLERFSTDPTKIQFYTGFQTYTVLMRFFHCLLPYVSRGLSSPWFQLRLVDQFFLFLNKVKLGSLDEDLADKFGVSTWTVRTVIASWANFLHALLCTDPVWPTRRMIDEHMPEVFKQFPKTRVILERTELFVQTPSTLTLDPELYPDSRGRRTLKCLMGISPDGLVTFVSDLYAGGISDQEITKQCGILDLLQAGDAVVAHKEFIIDDLLNEINCTRAIPPVFTSEEETQTIARLCAHVEWAIRRVKQFHLFDRTIPISLEDILDQLWRICCMLPNFQGRFLQKSM